MGFRPCWCPTPFPSPSTSGCFPFTLLRLPLDFISLFFTAAVSAPRHQPSSCTRAWDGHRATVDPEEEFYIHTYAHNAYINTFMRACIRTYIHTHRHTYLYIHTYVHTYVHMHIGLQGLSIKYVTLFLANFDPPSPCHTLSHIPGPPKSTSHISDPPIFSRPSTKIPDKVPCTNSISIVRIGFCPGWFLSVPPSVTIHRSI